MGIKKQAAYEKVKGLVSSALFLALLNCAEPDVPLELVTHASGFALGSVLLIWVDRAVFPIACYSRKLSNAIQNYSAMDHKLLGVDYLHYFCHCLLGHEFRVMIDHKPFLYCFSLNN